MRSEQEIFGYVERVARIPRWVRDGNIERVEIVVSAFDFRAVFNRVAHRNENIFDFLANDCQRMSVTDAPPIAWQRDVQGFPLQGRLFLAPINRGLQRLQRLLTYSLINP